MTNFSLTIKIDNNGLQNISNTGMSVALLQPDNMSKYQIVAVQPPTANNIFVNWTDSVSVYSSSQSLKADTVLKINSYTTALSGKKYSFDGSSIVDTGQTGFDGNVQLINSSSSSVTAGLATTFTVNEQVQPLAITTASSLLNGGQGTFQISNQFWLTLLGNTLVGMAVPTPAIPDPPPFFSNFALAVAITAQPPLALDFSNSNATQTVHYDDTQNVFVAGE